MFVAMYHPDIPSTSTKPVEVALQSVDDHAARGWLLVDPGAELPTPATPYYTTAAADSRFVRGTQLATKMAEHVGDGSAFDLAQKAASVAANAVALAANPDTLIAGAITRDANGAATAAPVVWPDGDPGQYTATTVSATFPGAVDAYTITKGSPVELTFTQPTVTRDVNGAVTQRPALVVA